jgi:hypothetical protein
LLFVCFSDRVSLTLAWAGLKPQSCSLYLLSSWDYMHEPLGLEVMIYNLDPGLF